MRLRRAVLILGIVAGVAAGLAAWYVIPLIVDRYQHSGDVLRRSQIGQSFGSSGALFSSLALVGVVVALLFQRREVALQRAGLVAAQTSLQRSTEASFRLLHVQLLSIAFTDNELLEVWRYDDDPATGFHASELRKSLYANLIISHIESFYVAGLLDDAATKDLLTEVFASPTIRRFWAEVAGIREQADAGQPREAVKRFIEIANDVARSQSR